jgi:prophage maintenance system killer protein
VVDSQFALVSAVQRPQVTTLGREAYPSFSDKVAALVFALVQARAFRGGNRRVALASLVAFCELNNRTVDTRIFSNAPPPAATSGFRRRTSSASCARC